MADYLKLAQEAFESSSSFLDANYRSAWEYSLKAFNNEHASGSKYLDEAYKARSRLFRPKTRSIIRKNEAAAAAALFSSSDVVNITPGNPDDVMSVASAAAMKEVLEYRLTKSIPSFQVCMGGVQDAQTVGVVCSYQYWEYEEKDGKKLKDKPCIELRPIENIRIDAGASWLDPVETSPYFCDIIPMYVGDVRSMMETNDPKTGKPKWKKVDDEIISKARPETIDGVRKARLGKGQDPHQEENSIKEFDTVWVMRWFIKQGGVDMTFHTIGTEALLTDPVPVEQVYFHGKRPYVIGYSVLETHKALKTGLPMLVKPLQQETNEIANQRIDNVKFVLNKRWLVARGRQVDVNSLVRNVPGGVTLTTDPNMDIKESNWPDVTSSAYVEQDRINSDLDELAGNFSPSTKVANNAVNDTLGGSRLASQGAGMMTDYLLKTIIETWWEPVLRQLVLLEQYYETDEVILALCAQKARLFPKFGLSQITDDLLMREVNLTVNVGMGSANPEAKLQKFLMATNAAIQIRLQAPPGANVEEMTKEIYSHAGYRDGARFFNNQQDPRLVKAMQMIQQLEGALKGKQMEIQADSQIKMAQIGSNEKIKGAEIQVNQFRIEGELRIKEADIAIKAQELELEKLRLQLEAQESAMTMQEKSDEKPLRMAELRSSMEQAEMKLEGEKQKLVGLAMKIAQESEKAQAELGLIHESAEKEKKTASIADGVSKAMSDVLGQVEEIKSGIVGTTDALRGDLETLKMGLGAVAGAVASTKKKNPKGFALVKGDDKKTKAVRVSYDDDSVEEIAVM